MRDGLLLAGQIGCQRLIFQSDCLEVVEIMKVWEATQLLLQMLSMRSVPSYVVGSLMSSSIIVRGRPIM
jgi:hypothetical protein